MKWWAQVRPTTGTTMRDGAAKHMSPIFDERVQAMRWVDSEVDAEYAAGRMPGKADVFPISDELAGKDSGPVTNGPDEWRETAEEMGGDWILPDMSFVPGRIRLDSEHAPICKFFFD